MKRKSQFRSVGLFILRVGISAGMLMHGWPKLEKLISGGHIRFSDPLDIGATPSLILAVIGEFVAPIIIILGLKTRLAALPAAITMGVAFFMVHAGDAFKDREMAFLYLIGFTVLIFTGGGKFSIDGALDKRNGRR
jgi:putative oxidoreductase